MKKSISMRDVSKKVNKDIIRIFKNGASRTPLYLLATDNCSEASRLVAIWIKREFENANFFIIKGEYIPNAFHDVLVIQDRDRFYLLDPTIFQFFRHRRTLFIGEFNTMNSLRLEAKKIYGGTWEHVEKLHDFTMERMLIKMIQHNR